MRFANVEVLASDTLVVDVQLSNPTMTLYSISSLSLRFTFNENMLGAPIIEDEGLFGWHSLMGQGGIWS